MSKIILFTDSLGAGGAQRQLVGLAVMLKNKSYDVKVCTYHEFDFYKQYLDENNVSNELIPRASNTKRRILAVYKYFKKEKPDWVIAYQETPSLVACISKILGCEFKLIVSERNTTQKIGMNERIRFFLYHWADFIVPNSFSQASFLLTRCPWMSKTIKTIINFVDIHKFCFEEHSKRDIPEVLVVGSISHSKNTKGFVKACKLLKDKNIKFHATWYGWHNTPTDYMLETKQLISQMNLGDLIELKNKTLDIAPKYRKADFFCIPSYFEGTPNVLCEAIASGLPVAASNVCDNSLYVQEDVNGFLFEPSSIESIANTLERLITIDEHKYQLFRKHSRRIAEKKLSDEVFLSEYCSILNT